MLVTREDLAADVFSASNGLSRIRAALQFGKFDFGVNYAAGLSTLSPHLSRMKPPATPTAGAAI